MARIEKYKELQHQPIYDTLIRTTGDPSPVLGSSTRLFGNANVGSLAHTNLQVAGHLASDQTFMVKALRAYLYFKGTNSAANYDRVMNQLHFTLVTGDKPMFTAPCWYFPAGGGVNGASGNGAPTHEAIAKLGRPVALPVRQNFSVTAEFFAVGTTSALDGINSGATDDEKIIMFFLDGLRTRDVQ